MQRVVDDALAAGTCQVLVVAGGFDTLCLRLAPRWPDVRFVEIDHPGTSAAKANAIAALGWPPNMKLLAADLGERPLSTVMAADEDWDVTQPSVVVVEGLLQYLSDDDAVSLVSEVAACVPSGSPLAVSHMIPNDLKFLRGLLRLTGEPFLSSVASEDFTQYIDGTGWTVTSGVDGDPKHGIERYAVAEPHVTEPSAGSRLDGPRSYSVGPASRCPNRLRGRDHP